MLLGAADAGLWVLLIRCQWTLINADSGQSLSPRGMGLSLPRNSQCPSRTWSPRRGESSPQKAKKRGALGRVSWRPTTRVPSCSHQQQCHNNRPGVCRVSSTYFTRASGHPDVVSVFQMGRQRPPEGGVTCPRSHSWNPERWDSGPRSSWLNSCLKINAYEMSRVKVTAGTCAPTPRAPSLLLRWQPETRLLITSQASRCVWSRPCGPPESEDESCGARNSFGDASKLSHLQSVSAWS